jgi:hypothetical protein
MAVTAELVPVRVPREADFDGEDFLADEVLDQLFVDVLARYERLRVIAEHDIDVVVLWKRKGGRSQGAAVFGKCVKSSGLVKHFGRAQFVIWLAADHCEEAEYTRPQIEKLLYHGARHIGWQEPTDINVDGEGKPIIVGHDVELFLGEVEDTGATWERFRRLLGIEFRQPGLFVDADEDA